MAPERTRAWTEGVNASNGADHRHRAPLEALLIFCPPAAFKPRPFARNPAAPLNCPWQSTPAAGMPAAVNNGNPAFQCFSICVRFGRGRRLPGAPKGRCRKTCDQALWRQKARNALHLPLKGFAHRNNGHCDGIALRKPRLADRGRSAVEPTLTCTRPDCHPERRRREPPEQKDSARRQPGTSGWRRAGSFAPPASRGFPAPAPRARELDSPPDLRTHSPPMTTTHRLAVRRWRFDGGSGPNCTKITDAPVASDLLTRLLLARNAATCENSFSEQALAWRRPSEPASSGGRR